jgi:DNA-directed RNA polymerase subunit omega
MSIYPSPDKLDSQESKYALVILSAKRARQLKEGARRLVDTKSTNVLTVALEEIGEGQIISRIVEDAAVAAHQASLEPHEPTLEDIIGAGPVLVMEAGQDSTAAQLAALRSAQPEAEDDLVDADSEVEAEADEEEEGLNVADDFTDALIGQLDEDEEIEPGITDEEE